MCHPRHAGRTYVAAAPARRDPRLRASDAERESAVGQLREHGAAGRLDVDELEQRVGAAYTARTHGELARLLADLPSATPERVAPAPDGHGWGAFLQVNALLVAIWALTGAGYFWPAWVIAWWGLALVVQTAPRLLRPR